MELFKESNPKAVCILYQYDTLKRYPHIIKLFDFFDRIYSFDIEDCQQYNLILRPLFFVNVTKATHSKKKYDVSTVCSYYPERQEILLKLKEYFKKNNISYFFYVFLHWKSFVKNFSSIRRSFFDIDLKALSKEKMFDIALKLF